MDEYCVLTWKLVKNGTPMILEAGVQEIVISRSGETFAAVCDDCKVRCRGRLRHATWQDLPAGGRQRQESRSSSESMNFSNSEDEAPQKCQQEEMQLGMSQQTLQEMTKLAPRRVYYPRGMTAMQRLVASRIKYKLSGPGFHASESHSSRRLSVYESCA